MHFRTLHHPAKGPVAGHGFCLVTGCSCPKFTWKASIFGGSDARSDEILSSIGPENYDMSWAGTLEKELETVTRKLEAAEEQMRKVNDRLYENDDKILELGAHNRHLEEKASALKKLIQELLAPYVQIKTAKRNLLVGPMWEFPEGKK